MPSAAVTQCQSIESKPGCIQTALAILGDKWTPLLLGHLTEGGKTFSDLELALGSISPRTLSQRLEKLAYEQIVQKNCYCDRPPRYKYELTDKGRELQSVLLAMAKWGNKHHSAENQF
jgi:DNA-binding HxlR family transcriptional regulator